MWGRALGRDGSEAAARGRRTRRGGERRGAQRHPRLAYRLWRRCHTESGKRGKRVRQAEEAAAASATLASNLARSLPAVQGTRCWRPTKAFKGYGFFRSAPHLQSGT